jgi:hypothetical protein
MEAVTHGRRCASPEGMQIFSERNELLSETRQVIESRGSFMDRTDLLNLIERLHQALQAEEKQSIADQFGATIPFSSH